MLQVTPLRDSPFAIAPQAPAAGLAGVPAHATAVVAETSFERLFDFPGIQAGDHFHLDKGSTVSGFGIHGEGRIDRLEPNAATIYVKGGRFGFHREATITIDGTGADTARLVATQSGKDPYPVDVKVTEAHTNYLRAEATSVKADPSVLQVDDAGRFVMDVDDAKDGVKFHLIMIKDAPTQATSDAAAGLAALLRT